MRTCNTVASWVLVLSQDTINRISPSEDNPELSHTIDVFRNLTLDVEPFPLTLVQTAETGRSLFLLEPGHKPGQVTLTIHHLSARAPPVQREEVPHRGHKGTKFLPVYYS